MALGLPNSEGDQITHAFCWIYDPVTLSAVRMQQPVLNAGTVVVTGTFWQATQPMSAVSLPLPAGASTVAKQPALGTAGTASADVLTIQGVASMTKLLTTPDNPTNLDVLLSSRLKPADTLTGVTTVATVTSLTQMNGAAIAMNTGVRTAGTQRVTVATDDIVPASQSGVWTVQPGNTANTTAWKVDGSAVTQPVSGTVTASGPLTDAQLRAAAVPISAASLPTHGVTGPLTDTELRATAVPVSGTVTAGVTTNVEKADDDAGYVDGAVAKALTQTPDGRLRVVIAALVSDVKESYVDATIRSLSLTPEGRLRVSSAPARTALVFAPAFNFNEIGNNPRTGDPAAWEGLQ